jgi:DNA-binding winged helix-turn-helix (wHTH) protein
MEKTFSHFDSLYPEKSRFEEIEKIFTYIKEGKSCQVISVPGAGRSNLLGFLAYNHNVKQLHLGENQKWLHFVYLNFSEVKNRNLFDVNKFIFLSLADSLKDRQMIKEHDNLHKIFKDHLALNDEIVLFQGLKEALDFLTIEKKLTVVFLFDQFETYLPKISQEFFDNLRIIRNRAKYRFSCAFSLTRPMESAIDEQTLLPFSEFINDNYVYLRLSDQVGLEFRLSYLEKIAGRKIPKKVVEKIIKLTGGHGRLTKLSEEIALSENIKEDTEEKDLKKMLLSKKIIKDSILEILNSLTPQEQTSLLKKEENDYLTKFGLILENTITIPLLETFLKERKVLTKEKLYLDIISGEVKKGEQIISDKLTGLEFKLLKYLLKNPDKVIERDEIINEVWSETSSTAGVTDQAVDQLISRLRKKIEEDSNNPQLIITIKGRGIKLLN